MMRSRLSRFQTGMATAIGSRLGLYQDILIAQEEMKRLRSNGFADAFVVAMEGK